MKLPKFALAALTVIVSSAYAAALPQAATQDAAPMAGMSHDMRGMQMNKADMDSMHMGSSPDATKAPTDLQFLDTMSMHHKMAVNMAGLAESRTAHAELKAMAKKMMDDQQKEITQMKGWREQWYAGKPEAMNMQMPGMSKSMMGMSMNKLAAAKGEEFDRMFIDMMSQHHEGAIKMSQAAQPKLQHAEIKALAKKIVTAQKEELAQMKAWKKSWGPAKH
jgi:uncharacterized protein (DUF305 family)